MEMKKAMRLARWARTWRMMTLSLRIKGKCGSFCGRKGIKAKEWGQNQCVSCIASILWHLRRKQNLRGSSKTLSLSFLTESNPFPLLILSALLSITVSAWSRTWKIWMTQSLKRVLEMVIRVVWTASMLIIYLHSEINQREVEQTSWN